MTRMNAQNAAEQLPEALEEVMRDDARVVIERDGREVAALISIDDLRALEEMEDAIDNRLADEAIAEMGASGEAPKPFNQVLREIGREDLIQGE